MRIAVLGAGPAGLFAAHAVTEAGWKPEIFSICQVSQLYGAQYLHSPIPGLTPEEPEQVSYLLHGSAEEYRAKVYGPRQGVTVSPEVMPEDHFAWDIRAAYRRAWTAYRPLIQPRFIDVAWIEKAVQDFDLVISTVPAKILCTDGRHVFPSQRAWAIGDAPDLGVRCSIKVPRNTVVCNGKDYPSWYRAANVFGYRTAEWPYSGSNDTLPKFAKGKGVPMNAKLIHKPIATNCDCWGDKVLRLGRYGAWNKNALSHTAFYQVKEYFNEQEAES